MDSNIIPKRKCFPLKGWSIDGLFLTQNAQPCLVAITILLSKLVQSEKELNLVHSLPSFGKAIHLLLRGELVSIFPPSHIFETLSTSPRSIDDKFVWQFFSVFVSCLDGDAQREMVLELRFQLAMPDLILSLGKKYSIRSPNRKTL